MRIPEKKSLRILPGRPEDDPLFCCLRGELQEKLTEAIEWLPERERLVMTLYYFEELTMREIGLALGVVESRVSQIHASAVVHLRRGCKTLQRRGAIGKCSVQEARFLTVQVASLCFAVKNRKKVIRWKKC